MADELQIPDIHLDSGRLYREETYTDRRMGTLRKLYPVHADGSDDPARPVVWEGSASLMTPAGTLPLSFEVQAETLSEALDRYPVAAREALNHTLEELHKLRREQASSIVVPGQEGAGLVGTGFKPR